MTKPRYKLRPDSMMIANNLASMLSDHRSDKDSLAKAAAAAQILRNSDVPQFQDTLGWALFRSGDVQGAVPLLEQAVANLNAIPEVNYHLGAAYAAWTIVTQSHVTNSSVLLILLSVVILLVGLVSEQISSLRIEGRRS